MAQLESSATARGDGWVRAPFDFAAAQLAPLGEKARLLDEVLPALAFGPPGADPRSWWPFNGL